MIFFYILIFTGSCLLLAMSGKWLIDALIKIARYLDWREFVIAFIVMAIAASLPNLFVGISAALHKIPELSFGDVIGGNLIDLTLVIALSVLIAKGIMAKSRTVQTTSIFTALSAILPLILILDGVLGRLDGIILLVGFVFYSFWLFSKKERFRKVYDSQEDSFGAVKNFKTFLKSVGKLVLGVVCFLLAAEGVVRSAFFFSKELNLPLSLIGILIVGLGNSLPEAYFSIISARSGQTWMILGDLEGSVMVPSTLVLGTVALIYPIKIPDFSPFAIGCLFLVAASLFFFLFVRSDRKLTVREGIFLLGIYITFLFIEIFVK